MDCGDSACHFASTKTGARTNGGCTCVATWRERISLSLNEGHYGMMHAFYYIGTRA